MTPLRQRMIEDMQLRNFSPTTQRSYVHYVAHFAQYFHRDPAELDLEAVRQYQLYLSQERKLSPQSVNTFVSAVQFLYLVTLEMPWQQRDFTRARVDHKLPVKRLTAHSNVFNLCMRYSAQADRQYRRAIDDFDRLKVMPREIFWVAV